MVPESANEVLEAMVAAGVGFEASPPPLSALPSLIKGNPAVFPPKPKSKPSRGIVDVPNLWGQGMDIPGYRHSLRKVRRVHGGDSEN